MFLRVVDEVEALQRELFREGARGSRSRAW
jgi:hypothetical protein